MNDNRQVVSDTLLQMIFDKLIFKCLKDIGVVEKNLSYHTSELQEKIKEVIRKGMSDKKYMMSLVDKWIDEAVGESIFNNENRWRSFNFDLNEVETIMNEDSIKEKVWAQLTSFIYNI